MGYKGPTGKCMVYTETAKSMQGDWFWSKPRTDSNGPITWARDGHRHGKCFKYDVQRIETVDVDLKITFISNGYCGTDRGNGWPAYFRSQGETNKKITEKECKLICGRIGSLCRGVRWHAGDSAGKCMIYTDCGECINKNSGDWYWSKPRPDTAGPIVRARDPARGGRCYRQNYHTFSYIGEGVCAANFAFSMGSVMSAMYTTGSSDTEATLQFCKDSCASLQSSCKGIRFDPRAKPSYLARCTVYTDTRPDTKNNLIFTLNSWAWTGAKPAKGPITWAAHKIHGGYCLSHVMDGAPPVSASFALLTSEDLNLQWRSHFFEKWHYHAIKGMNDAHEKTLEESEKTMLNCDDECGLREIEMAQALGITSVESGLMIGSVMLSQDLFVKGSTKMANKMVQRKFNTVVAAQIIDTSVSHLGRSTSTLIAKRSSTTAMMSMPSLLAASGGSAALKVLASPYTGLTALVAESGTRIILKLFGIENNAVVSVASGSVGILAAAAAGGIVGGPIGAAAGAAIGAASWVIGVGVTALWNLSSGDKDNNAYFYGGYLPGGRIKVKFWADNDWMYWKSHGGAHYVSGNNRADKASLVNSGPNGQAEPFQVSVYDHNGKDLGHWDKVYYQDSFFFSQVNDNIVTVFCAGSFNLEKAGNCWRYVGRKKDTGETLRKEIAVARKLGDHTKANEMEAALKERMQREEALALAEAREEEELAVATQEGLAEVFERKEFAVAAKESGMQFLVDEQLGTSANVYDKFVLPFAAIGILSVLYVLATRGKQNYVNIDSDDV